MVLAALILKSEPDFPDSCAVVKAKHIVQHLKHGQVALSCQDMRAILQDWPSLFWAAQWKWMRKQYYWPSDVNLHICDPGRTVAQMAQPHSSFRIRKTPCTSPS